MSEEVQVLFVTWDAPGSTYLEGLFLPIFAALRQRGFAFHVLQFTWASADERAALARACASARISYRSATIWRRPVALGSLATALFGRVHVERAVKELGIRLLVPRSTLPAVAAITAAGNKKCVSIALDADGLPHDERVEFGGDSSKSITYRLLRRLESWSVRSADSVLVRTERAAQILSDRAGVSLERFHVVPNARDPHLFKPLKPVERASRKSEMGLAADQPLLVYAGSSLRGKYLGDATFRFFRDVLARRRDARLLLLMPREDEARELLSDYPDLSAACLLRSVTPAEVPSWVGCADLGLALISPTFSMQAASAIKIGEYLLCGVPVLATSGVGDSEDVVGPEVGLCLGDTDDQSLAAAADWFFRISLPDEAFRDRCRKVGLEHFSLDMSLDHYEAALRAALSRSKTGREHLICD